MDLVWSGILIGVLMGFFLIAWDAFMPANAKAVGGAS